MATRAAYCEPLARPHPVWQGAAHLLLIATGIALVIGAAIHAIF